MRSVFDGPESGAMPWGFVCAACGGTFDVLEMFPGSVCVECFAASPDGQRMPSAAEVVAMWGGRL
jgi:predicted nucleic acid-binding Zn ribbon protein